MSIYPVSRCKSQYRLEESVVKQRERHEGPKRFPITIVNDEEPTYAFII